MVDMVRDDRVVIVGRSVDFGVGMGVVIVCSIDLGTSLLQAVT